MKQCPGTDALASIGAALDWNTAEGLRHLISCDKCSAQLRTMQMTHAAFAKTEVVNDDVVAKITHLISVEATNERERGRRVRNIGWGVEAALAGATALTVANGGSSELSSAVSAIVFALAATGVLAYRVFASSQLNASRSSGASIQ
jgi:hypothetical protein